MECLKPLDLDLSSLKIDSTFLGTVVKNIKYNDTILSYYREYQEKSTMHFERKIDAMENCNRIWVVDRYKIQKVKDFKATNLCRDKFCNNCKKVKQATRMGRFIPEMEKYKDNLYHLTLTQPNVRGDDLKKQIKVIFKAMSKLTEYLKGKEKIRGVDFIQYGYEGAVRSLEVTYNLDDYHPHLHVALVLTGDIGIKQHINAYSYDHKKGKKTLNKLFSDFEILIQKIWCLLITGKRVTKTAIDGLEIGYSCNCDKFGDSYAELFKYMVKEVDDQNYILTFDNFVTLYDSLQNVRQIQGYGCLFRIKDDDITGEIDLVYNHIVENLQKKELPTVEMDSPSKLLNDSEYMLISRSRIHQMIKKL